MDRVVQRLDGAIHPLNNRGKECDFKSIDTQMTSFVKEYKK